MGSLMPAFTACRTMCRNKQFQDEDKLKHLAEMLWYADQAYEGESERTLSKRLEKRGACPSNSYPGRADLACDAHLGSALMLDLTGKPTCRRPDAHQSHMHQHCSIPSLHHCGIVTLRAVIWAKEQLSGPAGIRVLCSCAERRAKPAGCCVAGDDTDSWCLLAGFGLVHVKLTSTWAEHCPAYFLAISLEKKEVIISVRGTAQVEDVITDLTALPRVRSLDDTCQVLESTCNLPHVNKRYCSSKACHHRIDDFALCDKDARLLRT